MLALCRPLLAGRLDRCGYIAGEELLHRWPAPYVQRRIPFLLPTPFDEAVAKAMGKRDNEPSAANTTASVQASSEAECAATRRRVAVPIHSPRARQVDTMPLARHHASQLLLPLPSQVLGVGSDTGCSVPSVLLFFDRQRFLFNAGEGFQRFCVEHRIKLAKVSGVLATRTTTEATGGLPGVGCDECAAYVRIGGHLDVSA